MLIVKNKKILRYSGFYGKVTKVLLLNEFKKCDKYIEFCLFVAINANRGVYGIFRELFFNRVFFNNLIVKEYVRLLINTDD